LEYSHLTLEERTVIMIYVQTGQRVEAAARVLRRSAATIRRELARNPSPYEAVAAHARAAEVTLWRRRRKLDDARLRAEVDRRLREDHSPWQVARRLKRDFGHSAMWASH
jgi:IS30 family transposase